MAVEARSLVCPRISMLSWIAALTQEEDPPLLGRLALPLLDASLTSPKDQNWQALKRRAAVCLRGQRHEFSSHGLGILPARACACRYPLPLWLGSLGRDSHGSRYVGNDSLPQCGCDPEPQLPDCAGMLDTRYLLARGTHCSKRPRRKSR